jgi:hypothetical protein
MIATQVFVATIAASVVATAFGVVPAICHVAATRVSLFATYYHVVTTEHFVVVKIY